MAVSVQQRSIEGSDRTIDPSLIPAIASDGSLFPVEKLEAHRRGIYHVAVSVFVFAGDDILIQRRAADKYHCGGLWANTCCSHPHWNEPVESAASRRLLEELGMNLPLARCNVLSYAAGVTQGLFENEQVHVFKAQIRSRSAAGLSINSEEVSEVRWSSLDDIRRDALASPSEYAPWFRIYLDRWSELGL